MSNAKRNIFVTTALPYANGAFHTTCILYALTTLTVPRL